MCQSCPCAVYQALRPTISISFVNRILFPGISDYHLDFQLRNSRHPDAVFSDHQSIHLLELPKFQRKVEEIATPLEAWCYFLIHGSELDTVNYPSTLQAAKIGQAMEVLEMVSQSDIDRYRHQARIRAERDRRDAHRGP